MAKPTKEQYIAALTETALAAVSYVGLANYDHRQRAADRAIYLSAQTGRYVDPETCETSDT